MTNKYLFTAFSRDRVGIVADISRVIYENGYNLEDSSMTYLADEFAILLLLSASPAVPEEEVMEKLAAECRRLEREKNITAYIRPASKEHHEPGNGSVHRTISVEGLDQTGIVYRISSFLAEFGINIRTLDSKIRQSPQSGASLYSMTIHVDIPENLSLQNVEEGLGAIGDRLNVDVTIS